MNTIRLNDARLFVLSIVLSGLIFAVDLSLPLGVAGGVPYVIVVLASLWSPRRRHTYVAASTGTALTVLGYFFSAAGGILWMALANRLLALFVIWAAALVVLQRKSAVKALRLSEERYRNLFHQAPISLWEEDFSALHRWFAELRKTGVSDLRDYFQHHPEAAQEAAGLVRVVDVNEGTLRLFGVGSMAELLSIPFKTVEAQEGTAFSNQSFAEQLIAIWEGRRRFETEFTASTPEGTQIDCLLQWVAPQAPGTMERSHVIIAISDITERKQAEEEMRLAAQITEHIAEGIALIRRYDGTIVYTNERFDTIFGYGPGELIGQHVTVVNASGEKSPEETAAEIIKELEADRSWSGEVFNVKKDGTKFWSRAHVSTFEHSLHGTVWLAMHEDITERKQAEEELHRYAHIVSSSSDMLALIDRNYVYLAANAAYLLAFAKISDEVIGRSVAEVLGEELFGTVVKPRAERCLVGETVRFQNWFEFPAAGRKYMDVAYSPYVGPDGEVKGFVVTARDITERKQAETALRESELWMRNIFNSLEESVLVVTADRHLVNINAAAERTFGYSKDELANHSTEILHVDHDHYVEFGKRIRKAFDRGETARLEFEAKRKNGEVFPTEHTVSLLKNDAGKAIGIVSVIRDITERKQAEEALRESERRLRSVLDGLFEAPIGLCFLDRELRYVFINEWLAKLNGTSVEGHLGRTIRDVLPEIAAGAESQLRHVLETNEPIIEGTVEVETPADPGQKRVFLHNYYPVVAADGAVVGVSCAVQDVTERRGVEQALVLSERRYRAVVEDQTEFICRSSPSGRLNFVNNAYCRYFGRSRDELIGSSFTPLIPEEDRAKVQAHFASLSPAAPVATHQHRVIALDGQVRWNQWTNRSIYDDQGRYTEMQSVGRDITESKLAEQALQESEERFRRAVVDAPVPIMIHAEDGEVLRINRVWTELTGYRPEEIPTIADWTERAYGARQEAVRERIDKLYRIDGRVAEGDYTITTKDGRTIIWDFSSSPLGRLADGRRLVLSIATDVTERKRMEADLRESEKRYRELVDALPHGIEDCDLTGTITFSSPGNDRLKGYDAGEVVGQKVWDCAVSEEAARELQRRVKKLVSDQPAPTPWIGQIKLRDGRLLDVQIDWNYKHADDGTLTGFVSVITDITARRRAEAQVRKHQEELAHMSRLSTMGEMATSLAHELNQPLASIVNYTRGCVRRLQAGRPDIQELVAVLNDASSEAQRAGEIIKKVRGFVRKREPARVTIDVPELIRQALDLMRHDLQHQGIQMQLEVEEQMPTFQGDQIQLQQVLLNLLRNSVEAMSGTEMKHRRLTVGATTDNGDSVTLFVRDSGCGLGEEDPDRLFEPFYTTKEDGTGMGLAISRTIVEAHGGRLWATDNADGGCTFHFSLPQYSEP